MAPTAHRVRTTLAIAFAGAALLTALLLRPRSPCPRADGPDGPHAGLDARFVGTKLLAGTGQDLAVWITAPRAPGAHVRLPLAVAIVIDRSGSMSGEPIEHAKSAAASLLDELGENDHFTIITYSSEQQVVMPMTLATPGAREQAKGAIARIFADGGTCISCGLETAQAELSEPHGASLRRIVLISDGQANEGIADRGELARLAGTIAQGGVSISAVGVGLDFDEVTMTRLAEVGHGNYYFVEDTANLGTMFAHELGSLEQTVASDVSLAVDLGPSEHLQEVYGYPARLDTASGHEIVSIPVADLRSGETRKVVLRVGVPSGTGRVADGVTLHWRLQGVAGSDRVHVTARAELTDDASAAAASIDRAAATAAAQARAASALDEAAAAYERGGYEEAQQVLHRHAEAVRADPALPAATARELEQLDDQTIEGFAAAPAGSPAAAKPMKATRAKAYELAR